MWTKAGFCGNSIWSTHQPRYQRLYGEKKSERERAKKREKRSTKRDPRELLDKFVPPSYESERLVSSIRSLIYLYTQVIPWHITQSKFKSNLHLPSINQNFISSEISAQHFLHLPIKSQIFIHIFHLCTKSFIYKK